MVVTPFGHMRLGDDQATLRWLLAHKIEHKRLHMGGLIDGPVDGIWMLRHTQQHVAEAVRINKPLTGADAETLRLPSTWRNEQELQSWHLLHNRLHDYLTQAKAG